MNERAYGAEYYLPLHLLVALEQRLPPDDRRDVAELIDANECGLALQTIGDVLAEESIPVDDTIVKQIVELANDIGLPSEVAERFRPAPVG